MVRTETPTAQAVPAPQQFIARNLPLLERKIDDAIAGKPEAVDLILSAVQIVDSGALNWILQVQARLETNGTKLRLVELSPVMADVLLATRLDSRLGLNTSAATAEGSLSPAGGVHGR